MDQGISESELMNGGAKIIPVECPNQSCRAKLWDLPDTPTQEERDVVCMVCDFKGTRKKGK